MKEKVKAYLEFTGMWGGLILLGVGFLGLAMAYEQFIAGTFIDKHIVEIVVIPWLVMFGFVILRS